ncbi:dynactin p62 family-domain-containing protein [Lineolata rhizophorae]|uniref:Dynactin subunit 4 n=1 Tax=Lineolata rhizophorae TaxID=578093 RepID=A0A6A6NVP6_9PEZI|nr:dynactin p62 family-domain-containing protein [Lineolata rhizophorae]
MAQPFPYTFYQCPCQRPAPPGLPAPSAGDPPDAFSAPPLPGTPSRTSASASAPGPRDQAGAADADDFDPRGAREQHSLFPLEHLLYCDDCAALRCPRCVVDEILSWFCPSCLFEVPSSQVRADGPRCARNCYNCPVCTAPLSVVSLDAESQGLAGPRSLAPDAAAPPPAPAVGGMPHGPFMMSCGYCNWTTLDVGVQFEKATNITGQLARTRNGGLPVPTLREREKEREKRRELREQREQGGVIQEQQQQQHRQRGTTSASSYVVPQITTTSSPPSTPSTPAAGSETSAQLPPGPPPEHLDPALHFSNLAAFYKTQLSENASGGGSGTGIGASSLAGFDYNSPTSFSRIMSLYGTPTSRKAARARPKPWREAASLDEGLVVFDDGINRKGGEGGADDAGPHGVSSRPNAEEQLISRLSETPYSSTATLAQRALQPPSEHLVPSLSPPGPPSAATPSPLSYHARPQVLATDLRPTAPLLRTKRTKRCRECRHILHRLESKLTSTRPKIRLLALDRVPRLSLRALAADRPNRAVWSPAFPVQVVSQAAAGGGGGGGAGAGATPAPAIGSINSIAGAGPARPGCADRARLEPGVPLQLVLRVANPLFDPVRVQLASPPVAPGPVPARTTILCPHFEVGANTDVWDEALSGGSGRGPGEKGARRGGEGAGVAGGAAEAGKVWERGRNWTSVVVEVVVPRGVGGASKGGGIGGVGAGSAAGRGDEGEGEDGEGEEEDGSGGEDGNVLEIPVHCRVEYDADASTGAGGGVVGGGSHAERRAGGGAATEKRQVEFWVVFGVGRVAG